MWPCNMSHMRVDEDFHYTVLYTVSYLHLMDYRMLRAVSYITKANGCCMCMPHFSEPITLPFLPILMHSLWIWKLYELGITAWWQTQLLHLQRSQMLCIFNSQSQYLWCTLISRREQTKCILVKDECLPWTRWSEDKAVTLPVQRAMDYSSSPDSLYSYDNSNRMGWSVVWQDSQCFSWTILIYI